jgi:hypothetical protein
MHKPFLTKRSPFRKKKLEQAGSPGDEFQTPPNATCASRISRAMLRLFVSALRQAEPNP